MDRLIKIKGKVLALCTALMLFMAYMLLPLNASAAPAGAVTTIGVSKKDIKVGESLSVTVTCTAEASITLRYSASRLKLDDPGTGTADGNTVTFRSTRNTIRFTAQAAGKADLIVASADAGVSGSSASVTITDSAAAAPAPAPASSAAPQTSAEAPAAPAAPAETPAEPSADLPKGQVSSGGRIYAVSERYSDAAIPAGFSKTPLSIAKGTYEEISNGNVTLVFLKLIKDGTMENEGNFFSYDEATGSFSPLIPYLGSFVIPLPESSIPEGEALSSSLFTKAELSYNSAGALAIQDTYVLKDDPGEFHYLYGKTFDGQTTWYSYDSAAGSLQRADTVLLKDYQNKAAGGSVSPSSGSGASSGSPASAESPEASKSSGLSFQKVLLIIIIFIVIFIILVIISMIPRRRDDDDDEEDEEDFGKSIVKKEYLDDEDEEEDDLPYGDDEEDDEDEGDEEDEDEDEKQKEKAPEKTRVMPDVSDNGLRKILSSDAIIASGQGREESAEGKKAEAPAQKAPSPKVPSPSPKVPVQKAPLPKAPVNNGADDNAGAAVTDGKKIDVMDLNDI